MLRAVPSVLRSSPPLWAGQSCCAPGAEVGTCGGVGARWPAGRSAGPALFCRGGCREVQGGPAFCPPVVRARGVLASVSADRCPVLDNGENIDVVGRNSDLRKSSKDYLVL